MSASMQARSAGKARYSKPSSLYHSVKAPQNLVAPVSTASSMLSTSVKAGTRRSSAENDFAAVNASNQTSSRWLAH
ncbi:hypothetical protein OE88DRAFT_1654899 [Heliocybe sulcata]|uniref:Uncharacterized protein n=1 Tax=Heliocybe sulcata TaxID=5364 RepID=A0A5C3NAJ3_9AGAM|nr:hypothetical protein OE88DRAFT_1654899 [Heliocybe sulcata]